MARKDGPLSAIGRVPNTHHPVIASARNKLVTGDGHCAHRVDRVLVAIPFLVAIEDGSFGSIIRVPDPNRPVLACADQKLAPVHRHRTHPGDPALVALQHRPQRGAGKVGQWPPVDEPGPSVGVPQGGDCGPQSGSAATRLCKGVYDCFGRLDWTQQMRYADDRWRHPNRTRRARQGQVSGDGGGP